MKRSEIFFDAILVPLDFLAVFLAGIFAYSLRVSPSLRAIRPVLFEVNLPINIYVGLVALAAVITIIVFAALGLYSMQVNRPGIDEFTRILAGTSLSAAGIIIWLFLRAQNFESRFILVAAWLATIILATLFRRLVRIFRVYLYGYGIGVHRVVLIGSSDLSKQFISRFEDTKKIGYKVTGQLQSFNLEKLNAIRDSFGIDEIIQCDPQASNQESLEILDYCENYKIDYKYVPNLYSTRTSNVLTRTLAGFPIVELRRTPLDGWGRVFKRAFDLIIAVAGLVILSPFFAIIACIISWDSEGPIFFKQKRVGRNQKTFRIVKFRTMVKDAEERKKELMHLNERSGPLFKIKNDPRITRVGRILRKYRIDELPQLWNVIRNEMSLIGPRPHLPEEIGQYRKEHLKLFTLKPGMTGLAQVSGSSDLSFDDEANIDIQYIEQWNPKLDLQVFLRTLRRLLWDRSAV